MDYRRFSLILLSDALFYDAEYGLIGSVSLIDQHDRRERYLASFDAEEETYLIEEATDWEESPEDPDEDVGYMLASDGRIAKRCATSEETAEALLVLAEQQHLMPSFLPLVEDES